MDRAAPALRIGHGDDGRPIWLTEGELLDGIAIAGPAGGGKRSVLLALLAQQIARGGGAVFLEGGLSRRAPGVFLGAADQAGRLRDARLWEPAAPHRSHRYNPLLKKGIAPVASLLLHLGAPPARRAGSAVDTATRRAAEALAADLVADGGSLSLAGVRRHLARLEPTDRKRLEPGDGGAAPLVGAATWRRRLAQELDRLLAREEAALLMGDTTDIDLGEIVAANGLLYVGLGVVADASLAASLAALLLADLRVAVESRGTPSKPVLLLLDTAEAYLVPPLLGLLEATPRATLAPVVSLADPGMTPGAPVAQQVVSRMPARLAHRVEVERMDGRGEVTGRPGVGVVRLSGGTPQRAALTLEEVPVSPERTEALRARLLAARPGASGRLPLG
jgi:hypothetical protein